MEFSVNRVRATPRETAETAEGPMQTLTYGMLPHEVEIIGAVAGNGFREESTNMELSGSVHRMDPALMFHV